MKTQLKHTHTHREQEAKEITS